MYVNVRDDLHVCERERKRGREMSERERTKVNKMLLCLRGMCILIIEFVVSFGLRYLLYFIIYQFLHTFGYYVE